MEMLTPTEGVDFNEYLHRVYIIVKRNWFSVMPESVRLGDKGVVVAAIPHHEKWNRSRRRAGARLDIRQRAARSRRGFVHSCVEPVRTVAAGVQRSVH